MRYMQIHQRLSSVATEPPPKETRRAAITVMLFIALATAASSSGLAQEQLLLTADVGKSEFFEDEPIYLLVRLQNVGTDTARVSFFSLLSPAVALSVRRGHAELTPVAKPVLEHRVPLSWLGEPVPPGASILKTIVLQDLMGDAWDIRSHLFAHHLAPDQYELHVDFKAHWRVPDTTPLTVEAVPIVFRIRARTRSEESDVRELEALRHMGWDTTRLSGSPRATGYHASLIKTVEERLHAQPDDPFLPFLLCNGLYVVGKVLEDQIVAGKVLWFDADTSDVVRRLRLAVIDRHRHSTAGALLTQCLSARHPDQLVVLAGQLRGTRAGEMARYLVERNEHGQHIEKRLPH